MKHLVLFLLINTFAIFSLFAAVAPPANLNNNLLIRFEKNLSNADFKELRKDVLNLAGEAVPALVEVMKESKYPEKNRWMATFALADIMGEKASEYIAEYTKHPDWFMRLASLKVLLGLEQKTLGDIYANALKDPSYVVRVQALENIKAFDLKKYSSNVWQMLYDEQNYSIPKKDSSKKIRTNIMKNVIATTGDLENKAVYKSLVKMITSPNYDDLFFELDYALMKISKKSSPQGKLEKKEFWKNLTL